MFLTRHASPIPPPSGGDDGVTDPDQRDHKCEIFKSSYARVRLYKVVTGRLCCLRISSDARSKPGDIVGLSYIRKRQRSYMFRMVESEI
jgi:CRP-like cAMP-binding protein